MSDILKYQPGTIILFSEGEYSDFGHCGQVVTLRELDLRAEVALWNTKHGDDDWEHGPDVFVASLIVRQIVAPLECQTVHIGSYGRVEVSA